MFLGSNQYWAERVYDFCGCFMSEATEGSTGSDSDLKRPRDGAQLKVSKGAKIRNRYNQGLHLTQDTNGKVTNSQ